MWRIIILSKMTTNRERFLGLKALFESGINRLSKLLPLKLMPKRTLLRNLAKLRRKEDFCQGSGGGRKRKLKPNDRRRAYRLALKNPKWSTKRVADITSTLGSPKVSTSTMRRVLFNVGLRKVRPTKVPNISAEQQQKRLDWCLLNRNTDWSKVVFSDESMFQFYQHNIKVWTKKGQPANVKVPKYSPLLMVWGAISLRGATTLCPINGYINSESYAKILASFLINQMNVLYPDGFIFQQDNASPHTSFESAVFFAENNIDVMNWPANSPDLNPIENCWFVIKQKVEALGPTNLVNWRRTINKVWDNLDPDYLQALISSMPRRIEACILLNGAKTKY